MLTNNSRFRPSEQVTAEWGSRLFNQSRRGPYLVIEKRPGGRVVRGQGFTVPRLLAYCMHYSSMRAAHRPKALVSCRSQDSNRVDQRHTRRQPTTHRHLSLEFPATYLETYTTHPMSGATLQTPSDRRNSQPSPLGRSAETWTCSSLAVGARGLQPGRSWL